MSRPTVAEVDLSAIVQNVDAMKRLIGDDVELIAVLKADAYGHGAAAVGRALAAHGTGRFAVALTEEAVELHDAGIAGRILVLGCPTADDAEEIVSRDFEMVAGSLAQIEHYDRVAAKKNKAVGVHLKFDTGMGRIGFAPEEALDVIQTAARLEHVVIEGVMTHFPSSEDADGGAFTREQTGAFSALRDKAISAGYRAPLWHAANSAGVLYYPESHFDAVRPGIALYGRCPVEGLVCPLELRQALTLKTRITRIRSMPAGASISYSRSYRTRRPSRIALLPVGYADGFPRQLSNRGEVLVRGRRAPVVGQVCMDMALADVTDIADASEWDEAVLCGTQGAETITVEDMARTAETVAHCLLTGISKRVPRIYRGGPDATRRG